MQYDYMSAYLDFFAPQGVAMVARDYGASHRAVRGGGVVAEAVERHAAIQNVLVDVDDAGDYGVALEIDHLRLGLLVARYVRVGSDGLDAAAGDGQRFGSRSFRIFGVDVAVD